MLHVKGNIISDMVEDEMGGKNTNTNFSKDAGGVGEEGAAGKFARINIGAEGREGKFSQRSYSHMSDFMHVCGPIHNTRVVYKTSSKLF